MNHRARKTIYLSQCLPVAIPFCTEMIEADLASIAKGDWVRHVNTDDYQGDWSVVPLRTMRKNVNAHPLLQSFMIQGEGTWENLPGLNSLPAIQAILKSLPVEFKSVRLMRLQSGAYIKPHTDGNLGAEYGELRLHVPLVTNSELVFMSGHKNLKMQAGELWYVNASLLHSVNNRGNCARINLVMDCILNDWLKECLV